MKMLASELEYEGDYELDGELELEGEEESEEFFRYLAGLASRAASSPTLQRVGRAAARTALRGLGDIGAALGGPRGSMGARIGGGIGATAGRIFGDLLPDSELEFELESEFEVDGEFELEGEANPIRRAYPDALMEHLGHAATEAESEAEAEAFIGALVPLATQQLSSHAAPVVMRAAPQLIRGVAGITRTLRRTPATRPLVRTVPDIVRRTTAGLDRRVARGQQVTPQAAVRALAREAARVLSDPQRSVRAYRRSRALDRRYHVVNSGYPSPMVLRPDGVRRPAVATGAAGSYVR